MNTLSERRKHTRIELQNISGFLRQCDITDSSGNNLDITVLDISKHGMKFMINPDSHSNRLKLDDKIFFRGCIFKDKIGFLNSQEAVTIWQDDTVFGVKFTPSLDLDKSSLIHLLK